LDDLGLRRALSDRLLPLLVGAMVFLAALAGAASVAASRLASHWRSAELSAVVVQVPDPQGEAANGTRADAAARVLGTDARRLPDDEVEALLRPWLGATLSDDPARFAGLLPAVFVLHGALSREVRQELEVAVPEVEVAQNSDWQARIARLAVSLQACATLALALVAVVAAALVSVATHAGLAARRDAIEIVHGLGATDGLIAGRFAARITVLAVAGAVAGAVVAVPVLLSLAGLLEPFAPAAMQAAGSGQAADVGVAPILALLPAPVWALLATLPLVAGVIGWGTAQVTVRGWLGRLP
jgi:cell division transport system permease protein